MDARSFHPADIIHRAFGTHMADMHIAPHISCQHSVAHQQQLLGYRRASFIAQLSGQSAFIHHARAHQVAIFTMGQDRQPRRLHTDQRFTHDFRVHQRHAVIAQRCCPSREQILHISNLLALHAQRHRTHRVGPHLGAAHGAIVKIRHALRSVNNRAGVGHGQNAGHAAACRRRCTGSDGFFVLKARLAHMGMHVHKTRRSHKACSVDGLRAFRRQIMPHRSNQAPFEQQLARLVPPTGGVDYPRAADQFFAHPIPSDSFLPPRSLHARSNGSLQI